MKTAEAEEPGRQRETLRHGRSDRRKAKGQEKGVPEEERDRRRLGFSSPFVCTSWRGARPTGNQASGNERQKQFVVAGDCIAMRIIAAAGIFASRRTLHYILQRAVVLNKVEVGRSDRAQSDAKIANDRNGLQKHFRKKHGGAPIEIYAAGMHFFHERAEQAKVVVSGGAESGAVGSRVHVRNVRADGEMDGDGNAEFVSVEEDAGG